MNHRIAGTNTQGGRVIEVFLPPKVVERAREIDHLVQIGELTEEGSGKEAWLSQVQPSVRQALQGLETNWALDQIVIQCAASISTLKHPNPSESPYAGLLLPNRQTRRAVLSRRGR